MCPQHRSLSSPRAKRPGCYLRASKMLTYVGVGAGFTVPGAVGAFPDARRRITLAVGADTVERLGGPPPPHPINTRVMMRSILIPAHRALGLRRSHWWKRRPTACRRGTRRRPRGWTTRHCQISGRRRWRNKRMKSRTLRVLWRKLSAIPSHSHTKKECSRTRLPPRRQRTHSPTRPRCRYPSLHHPEPYKCQPAWSTKQRKPGPRRNKDTKRTIS